MWRVTVGEGYIESHVLLKIKEVGPALVVLGNLSSDLFRRIPKLFLRMEVTN